ncbi:MAG: GNAT family N-acetyltransferase [Actinomycetota bacterium]
MTVDLAFAADARPTGSRGSGANSVAMPAVSVRIEPLAEVDLPAVARLYEQFWGEPSDLERTRATLGHLQGDPDYLFLVAREGDEVVGTALGIVCHELYGDCRPFMVIEDFVVDAGSRRFGVGGALMEELEAAAAARGCSQVILVTEAERTDAVGFYESLGFESGPYRGFKKRL